MKFNKHSFQIKNPLLVGICNFTPDSFSDGGKTFTRSSAIKYIKSMINNGAQIIDIGAESSKPNSTPITYQEEIKRLSKILPYLNYDKYLVSLDSYKLETISMVALMNSSILPKNINQVFSLCIK